MTSTSSVSSNTSMQLISSESQTSKEQDRSQSLEERMRDAMLQGLSICPTARITYRLQIAKQRLENVLQDVKSEQIQRKTLTLAGAIYLLPDLVNIILEYVEPTDGQLEEASQKAYKEGKDMTLSERIAEEYQEPVHAETPIPAKLMDCKRKRSS